MLKAVQEGVCHSQCHLYCTVYCTACLYLLSPLLTVYFLTSQLAVSLNKAIKTKIRSCQLMIIMNYSRCRTTSGCRTDWSLNDGEPWHWFSRKEPSADSSRAGEVIELCRSRTTCLFEDEIQPIHRDFVIVIGVSAWQMAEDMLGLHCSLTKKCTIY
jgi:hypothetical protein